MSLHATEPAPLLLFVEDDADAADVFMTLFNKTCPGWHLVHAENGLVAVEHMMKHGMPQIIITDLKMPRMDGYELIAWVRSKGAIPRTPIIVMSSSIENNCRQRCREMGADDFFPKGLSIAKLRHFLHRLSDLIDNERVKLQDHGKGRNAS